LLLGEIVCGRFHIDQGFHFGALDRLDRYTPTASMWPEFLQGPTCAFGTRIDGS
jgi:hypothetical protein